MIEDDSLLVNYNEIWNRIKKTLKQIPQHAYL